MTATVEVDDQTHGSLEFAARMSNKTPGQLVARLVSEASLPSPPAAGAMTPATDGRMVAVYVVKVVVHRGASVDVAVSQGRDHSALAGTVHDGAFARVVPMWRRMWPNAALAEGLDRARYGNPRLIASTTSVRARRGSRRRAG